MDINKISEEYAKCYMDKTRVYMIENFLKTYHMQERKEVAFNLFPRQKVFLQGLLEHQNNVTTKPRQAGVTTTTAAFLTCEIALASPESPETILVIGNKLDLAQQMVGKIKDFLLQLPRWFWGEEFWSIDERSDVHKKDIFTICNKSEMVLFNGCRVIAKSSGPNAARGVSSVSWLVFDEAAFIENGKTVYAQAVATTSTGGHIIMISTPNGKDLLYYDTFKQAKEKRNGFHVTEFKWYQDPRYNRNLKWTKKDEETKRVHLIEEEVIDLSGNIKYDEERWDNLIVKGYKPTSPWYVNMCNKLNNDEQKIAQELDVSFLGSSNNVVPVEYIEMQNSLNVRIPDSELKDDFVEETWVWKQPIEGHRYLMAIDCSRGDSEDRTAIEIIDMDGIDENGQPCIEQVLEYHGKRTGDEIGEIAFMYGNMYGEAFTVIDCIGGTGDACLLTMMNLGYKNLYYDDPNLKNYTMQRNTTPITNNSGDKLPGFHCGAVRFQMLSNFANMVKTNTFKIRSYRVISELETWIFKPGTGRMDHMDGCHDDTITCLAMGLFVMQFSFDKMKRNKERDINMLNAWSRTMNNINKQTSKKYTPPIMKQDNSNIKKYGWLLK